MSTSYILGISAFYHDSAAALLLDGEVIAAAQQERFSRTKHDPSIPVDAIGWCLAEAGVAKMTLYKHFRSKDELLLAVLEEGMQRQHDDVREIERRVENHRIAGQQRAGESGSVLTFANTLG